MTDDRFTVIERFLKEFLKISSDPQHDYSHADRVRKNALKITTLLEADEIDRNLLQVVCLIHDAHYAMYRYPLVISYWFENYFALRAVKKLVKRMDLTAREKKIIFEAVGNHARSFPFRELHQDGSKYLQILQDADTIDYFNRKRVKKFKKRNWFTKFFSPAVDEVIEYGREHLTNYLNYPQVAGLLSL